MLKVVRQYPRLISVLVVLWFSAGFWMGVIFFDRADSAQRPHTISRSVVIPSPIYTRQEARIASIIRDVQPSIPMEQALRYARVYTYAAEKYGIDVWVLLGKDYTESRYNPTAVSRDSRGRPLAHGWAQFIELTGRAVWKKLGWKWEGVASLYDPERSIVAGAYYLRELLDRYQGDLRYALTAYNMGPTALDQTLRRNGERGLRFSYYQSVIGKVQEFQKEWHM